LTLQDWVYLLHAKRQGSGYVAHCPAHDDRQESLSINAGDNGAVVLHCFAGCSTEDVVAATGKTMADLYDRAAEPFAVHTAKAEAAYAYQDVSGQFMLEKRRFPGKKFCWYRNGEPCRGNRPLPALYCGFSDPVKAADTVYWVEGEKDCDNLNLRDMPAVSAPDGAQGKLTPEQLEPLRGKDVIILPDNDEPGHRHAQNVATALQGIAVSVRVLDLLKIDPALPEKGDISDLIEERGEGVLGTVRAMAESLPEWGADGGSGGNGWSGGSGSGGSTALTTISARELQQMDLPPLRYVIERVLPQGLAMWVAPSKYGKSWMALDACLSAANGDPFLGYKTNRCGVLYLALEDSLRRLQDRMDGILNGRPAPENFYLATAAPTIDGGLPQQVVQFIQAHPETGLVVIDVLERVRDMAAKGAGAYSMDYKTMTALKQIADGNNVCVLVLHHTRKMRDEGDVYNMISGTNGIMGASDTIWVLLKEKRDDVDATLCMTGRDIEGQSLVIKMDWTLHRWQRIGTTEEQEAARILEQYEADPAVKTIRELVKESPSGFNLSASDFFTAMGQRVGDYGGLTPATLGKRLQQIAPQLLKHDGVIHTLTRTSRGNVHCFLPRGAQQRMDN